MNEMALGDRLPNPFHNSVGSPVALIGSGTLGQLTN